MNQILGPEAPAGVTAVQDGPTSILVSWCTSSNATGYTISYTGGGSSSSETVSGGDTNSYTLTSLTNGETYIISIVATSNNLASDTVTIDMAVGLGKSNTFAINGLSCSLYPMQSLVSQMPILAPQQPLPSPSPGVFPVAQW